MGSVFVTLIREVDRELHIEIALSVNAQSQSPIEFVLLIDLGEDRAEQSRAKDTTIPAEMRMTNMMFYTGLD